MNKTIVNLQKSTIRIFDNNNNLLCQAIIIEIPVKDETNKVRPYLIFSLDALKNINSGYLLLKLKNGLFHKVSFDRKFMDENSIDGFVIYPIAALLNNLLNNNLAVEYSGIPSTICIDDKIKENLNEIEEMHFYSWDDKISNLTNSNCIFVNRNITPIFSSSINNAFVTLSREDIKIGSPAFVINLGGYFANNDIYMGSRIVFMGIVEKKDNEYLFVKRSDALIELINKKFESKLQQ